MRRQIANLSLFAFLLAPALAAGQAPAAASNAPEEIVVTAQKRSQKLQKVPMSIQVLDTKKLDQLVVNNFQDYVKFIPSLSFQKSSGSGSNLTSVYLRGVVDGGNANHSGPVPIVGVYLDEMPTTTIGGTLDVHVYDIARVEVLPGPQGTLYGASSESGTVRLITNPPNPMRFEAGYDLQGNVVDHGGLGFVGEGFVNIPLSEKAAVRLVAFDEHDTGFIDNVYGTRYLPFTNVTINNKALLKKGFNPVDTFGGRAELGINLNDDWTVRAMALGQDERSSGAYGYDPAAGYLQVQRFQPDNNHDRWAQGGLTITGHFGDYELTYAGSLFVRDTHNHSDYTDYTVAYDHAYGSYWTDASGNFLPAPLQHIDGKDHYTKFSNELRLASPATDPVHFIVGLFQEEQTHHILQNYQITGLGPYPVSVLDHPGTVWLTNQGRTDRDVAAFGEVTWDITPKLSVLGGVRAYYYDNSLIGYFGLASFASKCMPGKTYNDAPCVDLDADVTGSGETHKINVTYKIDDQRLAYFTYSTGFRPGGVNRRANQGTYAADELVNFEVGFKSTFFNRRLTFNTAIYNEDWSQFQFAFLGQNSLTIIKNAPSAYIQGIETSVEARPLDQLTLSGGVTLSDAHLAEDFCTNTSGMVIHDCKSIDVNLSSLASKGNVLPYTPRVKGSLTARYLFPFFQWDAHLQGSVLFQTGSEVGLRNADRSSLFSIPGYATVDVSAGIDRGQMSFEVFAKNLFNQHGELNRYVSCTISQCAPQAIYVVPTQPLTVGIKLAQRF